VIGARRSIAAAPHLRRLAVVAALAISSGARAEPSLAPHYDLASDLAVTAGVSAANLSLLLLKQQLAPLQCRWCSPPALDAKISERLRWSDPDAAAKASDVLAVTLAGAALGYGLYEGYQREDPSEGWANVLLVTEATSVAMLLDTTAKYAVGRQRPYAWRGETRPGDEHDRNLSFFSGHTTFAFAVAASSSTLLLEQRSPHATTYAFVAFGAAAATGYLRVAADRHYASDVLVGAVVGTLVGWAIPHYFHQPSAGGARLAAVPVGIAFVW
jgi:hypothetical protein